jgi:UDP-glucose 4,6-dehydratase
VTAEIHAVRPDRVVIAAGLTGRPNIDWCEAHPVETHAVNVVGTIHCVRAAVDAGIHVTNFATGCIYEYDAAHPVGGAGFTEDDPPNFDGSVYSRGKAAAEAATRELHGHLLFRIRMPFTGDGSPRCFLTKIANYARVVDVPNSISVLPSLLPGAVAMIAAGAAGVYNFVNPGPLSHVQLLTEYAAHVDASFVPCVMSQAEHDTTAVVARRSNCCLDASKLERALAALGLERLPTALEAVRAVFTSAPVIVRPRAPKSIIITGGAGFIGSAVVLHCVSAWPDARIVVVDALTDAASASHVPASVELVRADVCDAHALAAVLDDVRPDAILHLAAQTHVDASFANSLQFTHTNVLGTHTLLEAIRCGPRPRPCFVHVSTDEVYGESAPGGSAMLESSLLLPTNPYAASKAGAEALVHAYAKSFGINTVVVRMNNVYGPRQFPEKVVPRFLCRAAAGQPLQLQGSGAQTRHFLYVDDAAAAILTVAARGVSGQAYNVGSDVELSMAELAQVIAADAVPIVHVADRAFNDRRYLLADAKLRKLGWAPAVTWADGLARTREWYKTCDLETTWPAARAALCALGDTTS